MQTKYVSEKQEKVRSRYPGKKLQTEALTRFLIDKSFPLVSERDFESDDRFMASNHPVVTLFADTDMVSLSLVCLRVCDQ